MPIAKPKRLKKTILIEVEGETELDIELALDEALNRIQQGNIIGFDNNESGRFHFTVTDTPE